MTFNPLPVEPVKEPERTDRIGTALIRVTLYGDEASKPTLEELTDTIETAVNLQLGLGANATAEWT